MDDDELLALVADAFDDVGRPPSAAMEIALSAIGMRHLDGELAELVFDSWRDERVGATRAAATEVRMLSYVAGESTVDVELSADGTTVLGQVAPVPDGGVQVETADGGRTDLPLDDQGRFRRSVPAGPFRLRIAGRFATPWVAR